MRKIILLVFLSFVFTSCGHLFFRTFYYKSSPVKDKMVYVKGDREIIFLPMVHLGKQEFYDATKNFVTEKRNQGYKIYYEGIRIEGTSKEEIDTIQRKVRKILGFHLTNYDNPDNQSIPRWYKKYVGQTLQNTGIDIHTDTNADMDVKELIAKIEEKMKKNIQLDSCDFATPLDAEYKCKNYKKVLGYSFMSKYRDEYLSKFLINSQDKKIVLLYGANHIYFLHPDLRKDGFEYVEGKLKLF